MNQRIAGCLVVWFVWCCAIATGEDEQRPSASAAQAYQQLVSAEDWRERGAAVRQLEACGDEALPYLIRGTKHGWDKVQEASYQSLFNKFPDREETADAVVRGLSDDSHIVQYTCAFFAGTQKIAAAEPALRKIFEDHSHDLRLTAAKSLAELGHAETLPVLYEFASDDWYMQRMQANVGLKALSGKDLDDFGEYKWGEGAFVSGGHEARTAFRPIEDAELRSQRYHALAEFSRWLKAERPELYGRLDPYHEKRNTTQ